MCPTTPAIRLRALIASGALLAILTGCSTASSAGTDGADTAPGEAPAHGTLEHGTLEHPAEVAAAHRSLVIGDADGTLTMIDVATGEESSLAAHAPSGGDALSGDGRFVYAVNGIGGDVRVHVIDTGRWTVPHGDHSHSYSAPSRSVGEVDGRGAPVIRSGDQHTAIAFPDSGRIVVLDHESLGDGDLGDPTELSVAPHPGLIALPFDGHVLVTVPDAAAAVAGTDSVAGIAALDEDGEIVPGTEIACVGASDAVRTRVGAVFACADGAVLITGPGDALDVEAIAYPGASDGPIAPPVAALQGRTGRPSVAGVAGDLGSWRLDTRERVWTFLPSEVELVAAVAVSDDADLTVAVDVTGAVRVLDAGGQVLAVSEPLVPASVADPDARMHVRLIVDADRAYVSGPLEDAVFEIDYRDGARVTDAFEAPEPLYLERVG